MSIKVLTPKEVTPDYFSMEIGKELHRCSLAELNRHFTWFKEILEQYHENVDSQIAELYYYEILNRLYLELKLWNMLSNDEATNFFKQEYIETKQRLVEMTGKVYDLQTEIEMLKTLIR